MVLTLKPTLALKLLSVKTILDKIGRAKYFSMLDTAIFFHQIELEPTSRPLTAFSTNHRYY